MLELKRSALKDKGAWEKAGVKVPGFDVDAMIAETQQNPVWVHFGIGNIFRGFIAGLQQVILEKGEAKSGIIAADTFDFDIVDQIGKAYDNLTLMVSLKPDGSTDKEIVASLAGMVKGDSSNAEEFGKLKAIAANPSLQMFSFTITEKGYSLYNMQGELTPLAKNDMANGPEKPVHAMSVVAALLYHRFQNGAMPVAVVSMDNCSHNGEKVQGAVMTIAKAWMENGFVPAEFISYLEDASKVSFPWSMIDKITPRPSKIVEDQLAEAGIASMAPIVTAKNTFIAPFVNAEIPQYLVVEDQFPNGRPALEKAGVYFCDRDTVNQVEKMKVTTCLNPLHTALAVYGCLLGYNKIADEMNDPQLKALVELIGYKEGIPVVVDPKILSPMDFIREVIEERLPNPFIPDMPQRIATDTSQKIPVRFGETIKSYLGRSDLDVNSLVGVPLALAGWLRYLLGVNDDLEPMEVSSDPMLATLQEQLSGVQAGDPSSYQGQLKDILSNPVLFAVNLYEAGDLAAKVEALFVELLAGKGAVRNTLVKYLG